ncbi:MAG TPA: hypothetical protein VMV84_03720 [Dehalococcoidales bacterium]|nr:hypothetical protein [Dehalococcoidales bacterium]
MPNEEWEQLKAALKKPATPEARAEAAQAFEKYRVVKLAKGKSSKPELVSLGYKKTYPHAVPVDKIPDELAKNPEFYDLMKRVVTKEKS